MKKLFKIGSFILIVGLICLAVGYFNGGNKTVDFNAGRPKVITNHVQRLITNKQFDHLDLEVATADVVIKQGKRYQVTYYGTSGKIPQAQSRGKNLTVKQKSSNFEVNFNVNGDRNQDLIVITVPKGKALSGKIHLDSGDLQVSEVDLNQMDIAAAEGDVSYDHLKVTGGKTTLSEGDFTAEHLVVSGHYVVDNDEGDNTVTDTTVDGYHLSTDDGDNELNGEDKGDETLNQNEHAVNVLSLITSEGDNQVN